MLTDPARAVFNLGLAARMGPHNAKPWQRMGERSASPQRLIVMATSTHQPPLLFAVISTRILHARKLRGWVIIHPGLAVVGQLKEMIDWTAATIRPIHTLGGAVKMLLSLS